MRKRIISAFLVLSLIMITPVSAIAEDSSSGKSESWGKAVQKYVISNIGEDEAVILSLKATEDNVVILPQVEIDQAKDFYITAGYEDGEASELAMSYVKEINILYQEAIKNGFTVTDIEISSYLDQLKVDFQTAENMEQINCFINSFETEEEYWNFQFEMFKKDLPIQRYIAAKESAFINENLPDASTPKIDNDEVYEDKLIELQNEWVNEFENMKDIAEVNYNYIVK